MYHLVKRVLAVGSRFAPVDGTGLIVDFGAIERNVFAVALHRQLLQIGWKSLQVLLVGQDRNGLCVEEVVVPDGEHTHQNRQIALKWGGAEVLVHLVKALQESPEVI